MPRLLWLALTVLSIATPASAQREAPPRDRNREPIPAITVVGNGEVLAEPDEATVRLGVSRQAPTAQEAQNEVNAVAQGIGNGLANLGVERNRVQTSQLSLFPIFSQQRPGSDTPPQIVAYRAANVVSVRLNDLAKIGPAVDAGLHAGANELEGVSFSLRNDTSARQDALRRAVREARAKAEAIADALGMRLGGVLTVEEGGAVVRPPVPLAGAMMARAEIATPVSPGQINVTATVTIRYRIEPR